MAEPLEELVKRGYRIKDNAASVSAAASLGAACQAWSRTFSLYSDHSGFIAEFGSDSAKAKVSEHLHTRGHLVDITESVLRMHHFFEIAIKMFLWEEHPLLSLKSMEKVLNVYDLIKREDVSSGEFASNAVEFSTALDRLTKLAEKRAVGAGKFDVFVNNKKELLELNRMRNRISHRGLFVLHVLALDELMCRFWLPTALAVTKIGSLLNKKSVWLHRGLECGVDPISEIISLGNAMTEMPAAQVTFLKALLHAGYENPLLEPEAFYAERNSRLKNEAEQIASSVDSPAFAR